MPAGKAYPSGHLVASPFFRTCLWSNCWDQIPRTCHVFTRVFPLIPLGSFLILLIVLMSIYFANFICQYKECDGKWRHIFVTLCRMVKHSFYLPQWLRCNGLDCGSGNPSAIPGIPSPRVGFLMTRRLKTFSDVPVTVSGRLGMLNTSSCPWRWVPGSRFKFRNWTNVL